MGAERLAQAERTGAAIERSLGFECLPELDSLSYYNKKAAKLHATFNLALMHAEVQQPA